MSIHLRLTYFLGFQSHQRRVRLALEQFLDSEPEIRPVERVRDLLGRVESGVPDLGQRHREHLIRRLRRGE